MNDEDIIQSGNPRKFSLKRSASASSVATSSMNLPGYVRDTKSFTENATKRPKLMEKMRAYTDRELRSREGILTQDIYTNNAFFVKRDDLVQGGRSYSINEVAFRWKKDWRMWLWKNNYDAREHKSVGDQMKVPFIEQ